MLVPASTVKAGDILTSPLGKLVKVERVDTYPDILYAELADEKTELVYVIRWRHGDQYGSFGPYAADETVQMVTRRAPVPVA